jgi:hypothetical protein
MMETNEHPIALMQSKQKVVKITSKKKKVFQQWDFRDGDGLDALGNPIFICD